MIEWIGVIVTYAVYGFLLYLCTDHAWNKFIKFSNEHGEQIIDENGLLTWRFNTNV